MRILSIGEILWDVIGGTEYLGGAPFNFSAHAVTLGHQVRFISAVGQDARGALARQQAKSLGIDDEFLLEVPGAETGVSYVSNEAGDGRHRLPRPAAYDFVHLNQRQLEELQDWKPDWFYFGTLLQMDARSRALTKKLASSCPDAKHFYDINLRPNNYTDAIVSEMLEIADLVKLNEEEAPELARITRLREPGVSEESCRELATKYDLKVVCVTRGAQGSVLFRLDPRAYIEWPGNRITVSDTVGAGDAFSAALVHGFGSGWPLKEISAFANRVGALVASRPGATPRWTAEEALAL